MLDIIIPVYNAKKYLSDCINSIKKQIFTDWNIILINDGSTDGSGDICDHFAELDERIRVIHQKNAGALKARLNGISCSKSELIAFVDADDVVEPMMFQKLVYENQKHNADIVCCGMKTFSKHGLICSPNRGNTTIVIRSGKEEAINMAASTSNAGLGLWGKVYKRELFLDAKEDISQMPNIFWGEDSILNTIVFSRANKVVLLSECLYCYRVGGLSFNCTNKTMNELAQLYKWRKKYLMSVGADIKSNRTNLAQVLNAGIYFASHSQSVVYRDSICEELKDVIADIDVFCPNYKYKLAYDLRTPMADSMFRGLYREPLSVRIRQALLRFL